MINIRMQHKDVKKLIPRIAVIGVGGAGGNAVDNMISGGLQGADFIVLNTDAQALDRSLCETKLQLGVNVTNGLGAGAKPEVGRAAAQESLEEVLQYLDGANMAFITAGMGGGTGTGAAPIIAQACRERGILTVGVVTKPFHFEGTLRMRMAEAGIAEMQDYVDTLIVIPNQNLFRIANEKTTYAEAFKLADSVLQSAVRGVTDLIVNPGEVNLDFADIRTAMQEQGKAMMGMGEASGEKRAVHAAEMAINNPLLDDVSMKGARGVIINLTGGYDMTLFEVDEACNRIREEVDPNANIIVGSTFDESMEGRMRVSVVATGIDAVEQKNIKRVGGNAGAGGSPQGHHPMDHLVAAAYQQPMQQSGRIPHQTVETALPRVAAQAGFQQQAAPVYAPARAVSAGGYHEATARRLDVDTFAQQEFVTETGKKFEPIEQAPPPVAVMPAGSMRGAVYGNHFIPPKPIEVQAPQANSMAGDLYGPTAGSLSAGRPALDPAATQTSGGYNLKPPVPGQHTAATQAAAKQKRTPSLFERFTNPLRHHEEVESTDDGRGETGTGTGTGGGMRPSAPARPTPETYGLELRPSDPVEDELDIPAFLRRQAN